MSSMKELLKHTLQEQDNEPNKASAMQEAIVSKKIDEHVIQISSCYKNTSY